MHTMVIALIHLCLLAFLAPPQPIPIKLEQDVRKGAIYCALTALPCNWGVGTRYIVSEGGIGAGHTLMYINSTTRTITAYDPATDTHTALFTCPQACYDPVVDANTGRIGMVTDSGFAIYDPATDDYRAIPADFGVYGYKGASFRDDLRYVAYEARFDMTMRLMLTDLNTGETIDLYAGGVGNPSWTRDGDALFYTNGSYLWRVPIDGGEVTYINYDIPDDSYNDSFVLLGESRLAWRKIQSDDTYHLKVWNMEQDLMLDIIIEDILWLLRASPTGEDVAMVIYPDGMFKIKVMDVVGRTTDTIWISEAREPIESLAFSLDGRYLSWIEENPDMGFGFYDVWIADLSASEIAPIRVAEMITTPAERPSGVAWTD